MVTGAGLRFTQSLLMRSRTWLVSKRSQLVGVLDKQGLRESQFRIKPRGASEVAPRGGLMKCVACGAESQGKEFCSKECYREQGKNLVFIGHMSCFGYDYTIVTETRQEAESKLLADWKRQVEAAGTQNDFDVPFSEVDFEWLHEWNGTRVEATLFGKINQP